MNKVAALKAQLRASALAWSEHADAIYYQSKGTPPTILFPRTDSGHGNFFPQVWQAILAEPNWSRRLEKKHPTPNALPTPYSEFAREVDSSNSSDALLMNFFCFPGAPELLATELGIKLDDGPARSSVSRRRCRAWGLGLTRPRSTSI